MVGSNPACDPVKIASQVLHKKSKIQCKVMIINNLIT
jgi:hypothetical protein